MKKIVFLLLAVTCCVLVSCNKDRKSPTVTVETEPLENAVFLNGETLSFKVIVTDNKTLASAKAIMQAYPDGEQLLEIFGTEYADSIVIDYDYIVNIPIEGNYELKYIASDEEGNETNRQGAIFSLKP